MSEYQYYEFQAIDHPLTKDQMQELRSISSRAEITPTRFTNVYNFGDFRGNPSRLVEKYFDAHLYLANWGTHKLTFRFPFQALDLKTAQRYCTSEWASASAKGEFVILDFHSEDEGGDWDDDGQGLLPSLIPLRTDIAGGDYRALYLAWEELLGSAETYGEERRRKEAEREARERAKREREAAAAREIYLTGLAQREPQTWAKVDALITTKRASDYDEAARLLEDLWDLGVRSGRAEEVKTRIDRLRQQCVNRPAFIRRLDALARSIRAR